MREKLPTYSLDEKTIFIVDDDAEIRVALQQLLEAANLHVETFESAIEFLANYHPARQGCILLDVKMPVMCGIELLQKLNLSRNFTPVIVMSGYNDVSIIVKAMQIGAVDFLLKPLDVKNILQVIDPHLKKFPLTQTTNSLTKREQEVMQLILDGKFNKQIAHDLHISISTVEAHRSRIMDKFKAKNLVQLIKNYFHISDDSYK